MSERDRAAALMRARLSRHQRQQARLQQNDQVNQAHGANPNYGNGSAAMQAPISSRSERRVRFDPRIDQHDVSQEQMARGAQMSMPAVGSQRGILQPKSSPREAGLSDEARASAEALRSLERNTAEDTTSGTSSGNLVAGQNASVLMVPPVASSTFRSLATALFFATIFAVPSAYRPFWILIMGVVVLMYLASLLYYEWDRKAFSHSDDLTEDDRAKSLSWAIMTLYIMSILSTAVIAGLLVAMVWKIYTVVSARVKAQKAKQALRKFEGDLMEEEQDMSPPQTVERGSDRRRRERKHAKASLQAY